ncbi:hypothetical protein [Streptomyces sp. NL15-2K]|uniref:hypothetical protein n=1 Tax=Streptomyces sp. NL15-2K TaxID=376149 RepID=UPI00155A931E|nr:MULTISPECIES: hypothetical protein [Actinomycetes]WKX11537.1 hypothetical protein Q4V64_30110 [Kutzneria buriramensis]
MADEPASGPEESADEWLSDGHDELRSGLSRFLDVDGGLREVRAHADGHGAVVRGLRRVLDVERGLAAILRPEAAGDLVGREGPSGGAELSDVAAAVRAIPERLRLTVRKDPVIAACVVGDLLVRALELAVGLDQDRDRLFAEDGCLELYRGRVSELARAVSRACAGTRVVDRARDLERATALDRDLALELALELALHLDRPLALASAGDRDLALVRDVVREVTFELALNVDRDLDRARRIADALALEAGRRLNLHSVEGLPAALLDGALDDFTHADLTGVNPTDPDLVGIHWSEEGTRWPRGTDVEELRSRSQETAPNSGVYVLGQPRGGTSRTGENVRV